MNITQSKILEDKKCFEKQSLKMKDKNSLKIKILLLSFGDECVIQLKNFESMHYESFSILWF